MLMCITIWHVFLWIILLVDLTSAKENFKCPNQDTEKCSCFPSSTTSFTIQCADKNILVSIIDSYKINIQCDMNTPLSAFEQLPISTEINKNTYSFSFINCPLPDTPLGAIISKMGIAKLLTFNSHKDFKQNLTNNLEGLKDVAKLHLQNNGLTFMADNTFDNMLTLTELNLSLNNIKLYMSLFKSLSKLKILDLSQNKITKFPGGIFSNMSSLQILNLMNNNMKEIMPRAFDGLNKLTHLDLSYNNLEKLFVYQRRLKWLDLSFNKIQSIPDELFSKLYNLETLHLNNNFIKHLHSELFNDLTHLTELRINNNQISTIEDGTFSKLRNLIKLDMSHNFLDFHNYLNHISPFNFCLELEELDLSSNYITEIYQDWRISFVNLKNLDLSDNSLTAIWYDDLIFDSGSCLEVDLRSNKITEMIFRYASEEQLSSENRRKNTEYSNTKLPQVTNVLVEHNPILCSCVLHEFLLYLEGKPDPEVRRKVNVVPGELICRNPPNLKGKSVTDLQLEELLCPLDDEKSHGEKRCPDNCECFVRSFDKASIVNCSGIIDLPEFPIVPGITNHIELHLEEIQITSFDELLLDSVNSHVTRLYLRNNNITQLNIPSNIEILDIRENNISVVDDAQLAKIQSSSLQKLWLSANPLSCDCDNFDFITFLKENHTKLVDYSLLTCPDKSKMSSLELSFLCSVVPSIKISMMLILIFGLAAGLSISLFNKYEDDIKEELYDKGCLISCKVELDIEKPWDAYIFYASEDEEFAMKIVNKLERDSRGYKLYLECRYSVVGAFKLEEISRAIKASKRIIVLLSPNFLDSAWKREGLKRAHCQSLKENQIEVIPILIDEIGSFENLDLSLKTYLGNTNILNYGKPRFWKKLRYALPHRPCPRMSNIYNSFSYIFGLPRVVFIVIYKFMSKIFTKSQPPRHMNGLTNPDSTSSETIALKKIRVELNNETATRGISNQSRAEGTEVSTALLEA